MSEIVRLEDGAVRRVFGDAFSFTSGPADEATRERFFAERLAELRQADGGWLPRILNADNGVAANYYSKGKIVAVLSYEYETGSADVYVTSEGGEFGDTSLAIQVPFDEAVIAAEEYAASL